MGSISSRPPVPSQSQVVYVPATPAPTPAPSTGSSGASNPPTPSQSENRSASLLQRDRSRFGTILTGFRGLLSQNTQAQQRKTLLGE